MELNHWDEDQDGPLTEAAMRDKLTALGYVVTQYVYPPGTVFPPHDHAVDKIDGVLSGRFRMSMNGQSVMLEAGDTLVVGDEAVVSLDAVKTG